MAQVRATWPAARLMADGRVRLPDVGVSLLIVNGEAVVEWPAGAGWETEVIPDPEPRWDVGDVVVDAAGEHFVRTPAGRWQQVLGLDTDPVRPLTPMVPAP